MRRAHLLRTGSSRGREKPDREQRVAVVTAIHALHGWNGNGQPTRERMAELGLGEMVEPMAAGAAREKMVGGSAPFILTSIGVP